MRSPRLLRGLAAALGLSFAAPAAANPWDIDMVDAYYYRGYEWKMMQVPEGSVSINRYAPNSDRMTDAGKAMTNPYPVDDKLLAKGERAFNNYCTACHGKLGQGGAPVADHNPAEGRHRFPIMPPRLSGEGATPPSRTDGFIYLTIRNGAALMSGYSQALDNDEMWAIVAYMRTLDGAQYTGN